MDQEQIEKLSKEGLWEDQPLRGTLLETHISWIVLTAKNAFKIKKPVSFSFLDFSDLEKRRHFCEREVRLNASLSDLYLDVIPIKLKGNQFVLGGESSDALEFAVRMKRVNSDYEMVKVLQVNSVTDQQIRRLANIIADFHSQAEVVEEPFSVRRMKKDFNDIRTVQDKISREFPEIGEDPIEKAISLSDQFLDTHREFIEMRAREGFRRDLHGDFHAANIFLPKDGDPIIFDCIEFNDEMRKVDILDEIAFFCMDLESRQKADLSELFLKHYQQAMSLEFTDNEWQLFRYFKRYRANVRAKVSVLKDNFDRKQVTSYLRLMVD